MSTTRIATDDHTQNIVDLSELLQGNAHPETCNVLLVEDVSPGAPAIVRERLGGLRFPATPVVLGYDSALDAPCLLAPADAEEGLLLPHFESVPSAGGEQLLMITAPGARVRLNGLPAPLVASLALGDQVSLGRDAVFHVSRIQRAAAAPPPPEIVGVECSVCLVEFSQETDVVLCPKCRKARHLEGEAVPREQRLSCATLGACPHCQTETPRSDGFAYWPEA